MSFYFFMKLFEHDYIINSNGKQYLVDIIDTELYNKWFRRNTISVLNKSRCGNGGTTGFINYCLNEFKGCLILVPNRCISISKKVEYLENKDVCCVYGGCDDIDYTARVIIATYDQYPRLVNQIQDSEMDFNNRFWCGRTIIIDEYQKLIDECGFRSICFGVTDLIKKTDNGVILMSATPHLEYIKMLREYVVDKEIKTYTINYDDELCKQSIQIYDVKKNIKDIIHKVKENNRHTVVFYNCVNEIKKMINQIGDTYCEVLCSESNKMSVGEYYSTAFNNEKKLHFMTSAYFTGHDINERIDQCIIIGSPKYSFLCYSDRDIKQMLGRFRKGVGGVHLFYLKSNFDKSDYTTIKTEYDTTAMLLDAIGNNWTVNSVCVEKKQNFIYLQDTMNQFGIWSDKMALMEMLRDMGYVVYATKMGDFDLIPPKNKLSYKQAKKKLLNGGTLTYDDYQYASIMTEYMSVFGKDILDSTGINTIRNWWKIYCKDSEYSNILKITPTERFDIVFGNGIYKGSYVKSALKYVGCNCSRDEIPLKMEEEYGCYALVERKGRSENNDVYVVVKIGDAYKKCTDHLIKKEENSVQNKYLSPKISYFINYDNHKHAIAGTFDLTEVSTHFSTLTELPLYNWVNDNKQIRLPQVKKDKNWMNIKNFKQNKISEMYKETVKPYRQVIGEMDRIDSIIVDIDQGMVFSEFKDKYRDVLWTAYPTISNLTSDWSKFRVIIPLAQTISLTGKNNLKVLKLIRRWFCPYEDYNHQVASYVNADDWEKRYTNWGAALDIPQELINYLTVLVNNLQDFTYKKLYTKEEANISYKSLDWAKKFFNKAVEDNEDGGRYRATYVIKKNISADDSALFEKWLVDNHPYKYLNMYKKHSV